MFFILGIHQKEKQLDYDSPLMVHDCGKYGRYEIFMTYQVLHLFFIPLFQWNKKYVAKSLCCNTYYQLDPQIGSAIEKGENPTLREEDLKPLYQHQGRTCPQCHKVIQDDYSYCPYCGHPF